jgi:DNA repair exonuclease SbcCD nuclease subunit
LLDGWSNIVVVDKTPKIFETNFNKKISLVPWGVDVENIPQSDICFGHFEINSFYMNSYKVCDKGEDSQNLLSKSPFIISGHFHRKEIREYSNGQILYVGSPYQQNFGDAGDERGIYILNLKDNSYRFYKNNISPKHIKISIQKLIEKKIDANFLKENVSNNLISLNVDTIIDPQNISLLSNKIQKLSPKLFRIDYKEGSKSLITTQNFNIDSVNMLQNIEDFVLSLNIDHKPNLLEYLTNLYNKNLK